MKGRSPPASSPSRFSRCSTAHFQKDSWYECEGGYCSRCGLRRIQDSTNSCTWRNGRWEGNDKNRGCFKAEYACKRLNKAGSEDGIAGKDGYEPALNLSRARNYSRFVWRRRENVMLGHRHLLRQCARPKVLRSFSSTSRVDPPAKTEGEGEEKGEGEWSVPKDPTWAEWKKTIGKQFEEPRRPCNWLGGKVVEFVPVWY